MQRQLKSLYVLKHVSLSKTACSHILNIGKILVKV